MKRFVAALLSVTLAAGFLGACGADDAAPATAGVGLAERTVDLVMTEFAYEPKAVRVERGETVRFVFTNGGTQVHEAVIGDLEFQAEHEQEAADTMRHGGDGEEAKVAQADPGAKAQLVWTFDRTDQLLIGCHEPGHYQQGMVARVIVT